MPYTNYVKLRIIFHHLHGLKPYTIAKVLEDEGIKVNRFGVHKFLMNDRETGSQDIIWGGGALGPPLEAGRPLP